MLDESAAKSKGIGESLIELVSTPEEGAGEGDLVTEGLSSCRKESTLLHLRDRGCRMERGTGGLPLLISLFTSCSTAIGKTGKKKTKNG